MTADFVSADTFSMVKRKASATMVKLSLEQLAKLSDSEVDTQFDKGNIDPATYRQHVAAKTTRKAKAFSIALSDSGGFNFQGYDVGVNVWIPPGLMDAIVGEKLADVSAYVKANSAKSHELRKARKASDDYKASCEKRREDFKAKQSAS